MMEKYPYPPVFEVQGISRPGALGRLPFMLALLISSNVCVKMSHNTITWLCNKNSKPVAVYGTLA